MPDVHMRLIQYKRIASAEDSEALRDLQVEMIDRFGLLPDPAKTLFRIAELRVTAAPIGVRKIDANSAGGRIAFSDNTSVDPFTLVTLVQSDPRQFSLDGPDKLRFRIPSASDEERLEADRARFGRAATVLLGHARPGSHLIRSQGLVAATRPATLTTHETLMEAHGAGNAIHTARNAGANGAGPDAATGSIPRRTGARVERCRLVPGGVDRVCPGQW